MVKMGKYLTGVSIGLGLLTLVNCTANIARPNFAASVGFDASDVSVDPQTGKASTKYPNKPIIVPGWNYGYGYNPSLYNTWPPATIADPYYNNSDTGSANGPVFRSRFYR